MPFLGRMPSHHHPDDRIILLQGTLDLLILKTLVLGPRHGQGIARSVLRQSEELFLLIMARSISLYSGLKPRNGLAPNGTSARTIARRFYSLTAKRCQQLVEKTNEWQRLSRAIGLILNGVPRSEEV